jgi:hypothetical protein
MVVAHRSRSGLFRRQKERAGAAELAGMVRAPPLPDAGGMEVVHMHAHR